jgi:hypothetical protein
MHLDCFHDWTPMLIELPTLDTLCVFSFHTLVLGLKGQMYIVCIITYGIKPQWYKVTHWVFFISEKCESTKIYSDVLYNVIFIYTLWL